VSERTEAARGLAAAPSSIMGLHLRLKERLEVVAAAYPLFETKTTARAPTVGDGWLETKDPEVEDFPFLLVRPKSGSDSSQASDENATATIDIIIGTYSDEVDGWLDVLNIIDAIRADLGAEPAIADTAYEQIGPLSWELLAQQPRPQWFGTVTTVWQIPRPRRVEARNPTEA
jgi:hypothetical protein